MILRRWTTWQFRQNGFVAFHPGYASKYEIAGLPIYASVYDSGEYFLPGWASRLYDGVLHPASFASEIARLSAAAIRSDDPGAFVESVLAAYALGGWRAALQLAEAEDAQGAAHEQTVTPN